MAKKENALEGAKHLVEDMEPMRKAVAGKKKKAPAERTAARTPAIKAKARKTKNTAPKRSSKDTTAEEPKRAAMASPETPRLAKSSKATVPDEKPANQETDEKPRASFISIMGKVSPALRLIVFIILFGTIAYFLSWNVFSSDTTLGVDVKNRTRDFFKQPENSLDICLIGPSGIYHGWNNMEAWQKYKLTSWSFSGADEPNYLIKNLIAEVKKTQSPKVFVVDIRNFCDEHSFGSDYDTGKTFMITDNIPLISKNRLDGLSEYLKLADKDTLWNNLLYKVPLLFYHNDWKHRQIDTFLPQPSNSYQSFFVGKVDFAKRAQSYETSNKKLPIDNANKKLLDQLLDFEVKSGVPILYINTPYAYSKEERQKLNWVFHYLKIHKRDYIDFATGKIAGIDVAVDYRDSFHLNFLGAEKLTDYLSQIIIDRYGLGDGQKSVDKNPTVRKLWKVENKRYKKEIKRWSKVIHNMRTWDGNYAPGISADDLPKEKK